MKGILESIKASVDNRNESDEPMRSGEIIIRYNGIPDWAEQELFEYLNLLAYTTDGVNFCSSGTGLFHKLQDFYSFKQS